MTYSVATLATAAGVPPRTIRYYVALGLLERDPERRRRTVYSDHDLLRIRAIQVLQAQRLALTAIRKRLHKATREQLDAIVAPAQPAPPAPPPNPAAIPEAAERWSRVVLLPGIELFVRCDAGPLVARIANEIVERYRVPAT